MDHLVKLIVWRAVLLVISVPLLLLSGGCKRGGPPTEAAEQALGSGAVCSPPSSGVVMCVHDRRIFACVQNKRGVTACAPTRPEMPAEAP